MFAYSQTIVCVQANICLAMGKRFNGASIVPQWSPNDSSKQHVCPRNGYTNRRDIGVMSRRIFYSAAWKTAIR